MEKFVQSFSRLRVIHAGLNIIEYVVHSIAGVDGYLEHSTVRHLKEQSNPEWNVINYLARLN